MAKTTPPAGNDKPATDAPATERKTTAGQTIAKFKWGGTPEGRVAKSVIALLGDDGAKRGKLDVAKVLELCPWLPAAYENGTAKALTNSMVQGRYHYMWFTAAQRNDGNAITGERSSEHPLGAKQTNAAFVATYAAVQERGLEKPITKAEVKTLGEHAEVAAEEATA